MMKRAYCFLISLLLFLSMQGRAAAVGSIDGLASTLNSSHPSMHLFQPVTFGSSTLPEDSLDTDDPQAELRNKMGLLGPSNEGQVAEGLEENFTMEPRFLLRCKPPRVC